METISFPSSPAIPRAANPATSSASSISFVKPKLPSLCPFNKAKRITPIFLTRCSTKPDTATEGNSIVELSTESNSDASEENQLLYSSHSSSSSSSAELNRGLVLDLGLQESWDGTEIGSPVVKRFLSDDEERWYMWYHGSGRSSRKNPDSDSIGLAISSNGIHWERGQDVVQSSTGVGLVMKSSEDWWAFDTKGVRPAEVMIMSSSKVRAAGAVYWLYYTGFWPEEVELQNPEVIALDGHRKGFKSLPGLAISQDGRNWARIEGEHHSGALFDVGLEGEWDSLFIASPHVVFHSSGDIRMYYHSFDLKTMRFAVGVARSRDGMKWVKLGKIMVGGLSNGFDEMGLKNACVVRNKRIGNYLMAYEGVAADGRSNIGLAVSADGLKDWRRVGEGPVLKASEADGWDSKGVGCPCLVEMEGSEDEGWRLYYRGIGEKGRTGVGMAVSEGSKLTSFRRWATGFHL